MAERIYVGNTVVSVTEVGGGTALQDLGGGFFGLWGGDGDANGRQHHGLRFPQRMVAREWAGVAGAELN